MLLQVIQAFHAANIVHGDVKPANFLIKPSKHSKSVAQLAETPMWVKAIDFGCSQSVLPNQLLVRRSACRLLLAAALAWLLVMAALLPALHHDALVAM